MAQTWHILWRLSVAEVSKLIMEEDARWPHKRRTEMLPPDGYLPRLTVGGDGEPWDAVTLSFCLPGPPPFVDPGVA